MFQAQCLFKDNIVWSPWIPRKADNVQIFVDLGDKRGTAPSLKVQVWTKSKDTAGAGDQITGDLDISSVGQLGREYTSCNELIRYKFTASSPSGNDYDYVLFRMLSPIWFDDVAV